MFGIEKRHLQADEEIEFSDKQAISGSLLFIIWFLLMVIISAGLLIASIVGKETFYLFVLYYIVMALPPLFIILRNISTDYTITNKRIIVQTGIIFTNIRTATYINIASVETLDTFLGKYFGFSTVIIVIAGLEKKNGLQWKHTRSALRVKSLIENKILHR